MLTNTLITIFGLLFSGFATTIIVAIHKRRKERREREKEERIAQRTKELNERFEYKKIKYAEAHPKTGIKVPNEQEYQEATEAWRHEQRETRLSHLHNIRPHIRHAIQILSRNLYEADSLTDTVIREIEKVLYRRVIKVPQMLRDLFNSSTPHWKKHLILEELLNRLKKELW